MRYATYEVLYAIEQLENAGVGATHETIWKQMVDNRIARDNAAIARMPKKLGVLFGAIVGPGSFLHNCARGPNFHLLGLSLVFLKQDALIMTKPVPNEDSHTRDAVPYLRHYIVTWAGHHEMREAKFALPRERSQSVA